MLSLTLVLTKQQLSKLTLSQNCFDTCYFQDQQYMVTLHTFLLQTDTLQMVIQLWHLLQNYTVHSQDHMFCSLQLKHVRKSKLK